MVRVEDKEWLKELGEKIDRLIDQECDTDRAYFNFHVSVKVLGCNFDKIGDLVLVDDGDTYCVFCHAKTNYYDQTRNMYLCPHCFSKLENKGTRNAMHEV